MAVTALRPPAPADAPTPGRATWLRALAWSVLVTLLVGDEPVLGQPPAEEPAPQTTEGDQPAIPTPEAEIWDPPIDKNGDSPTTIAEFEAECIDPQGKGTASAFCHEAFWVWAPGPHRLWVDVRAPGQSKLKLEDLDKFYKLSGAQASAKRRVLFAILSSLCRGSNPVSELRVEDTSAIGCLDQLPTLPELGIMENEFSTQHISIVEKDYNGPEIAQP